LIEDKLKSFLSEKEQAESAQSSESEESKAA
jgi:hypothetical protein